MPLDVFAGYSLPKVRLDTVDTNVEELVQTTDVPLPCSRIRKVDEAHAGLPQVPLEDVTISTLEQVALGGRFGKDRGRLSEVWIRPDRDFLDQTRGLEFTD